MYSAPLRIILMLLLTSCLNIPQSAYSAPIGKVSRIAPRDVGQNLESGELTNFGGTIDVRGTSGDYVNRLTGEPALSVSFPHFVGSEGGLAYPLELHYRDYRNGMFRLGQTLDRPGSSNDFDPAGAGWNFDIGFMQKADGVWRVNIPGRLATEIKLADSEIGFSFMLYPPGGQNPVVNQWYEFYHSNSYGENSPIVPEINLPGLVKIEYCYASIGANYKLLFRFTFPDGSRYIFSPIYNNSGLWSRSEWLLSQIQDQSGLHTVDIAYSDWESEGYFVHISDNFNNRAEIWCSGSGVDVTIVRRGQTAARYDGSIAAHSLRVKTGQPLRSYRFLEYIDQISVQNPAITERLHTFEYQTAIDEAEDTAVLLSHTNALGGRVHYSYDKSTSTNGALSKTVYWVKSFTLDNGLSGESQVLSTYSYASSNENAKFLATEEIQPTSPPRFGAPAVPYVFEVLREQGPDGRWSIENHITPHSDGGVKAKRGLLVARQVGAASAAGGGFSALESLSWGHIGQGIPGLMLGAVATLGSATSWRTDEARQDQLTLRRQFTYNSRGQLAQSVDLGSLNATGDERTTEQVYAWEQNPAIAAKHLYELPAITRTYAGPTAAGEKLSERRRTWEQVGNSWRQATEERWIGDKDDNGSEDFLVTELQFAEDGLPLSSTSAEGVEAVFSYEEPQVRRPTRIERTSPSGYTDVRTAAYDIFGNTRISSEIDGTATEFLYDGFHRPYATRRLGEADYLTQTIYDLSARPVMLKRDSYNLTGMPGRSTREYIDGFGRTVQNRESVESAPLERVTNFRYNALGLLSREYRPLMAAYRAGHGFSEGDIPSEQYREFAYSTDGLFRVKEQSTPDLDGDGQREREIFDYGILSVTATRVTTGGSSRRVDAFDTQGRLSSVIDDLGGSSESITSYAYDQRDNLMAVTDASGKLSEFGHTVEGETFADFPDLSGDTRTDSGGWTPGTFANPRLSDSTGRVWDVHTASDSFMRPWRTYLPNTANETATVLERVYDELGRLTRYFSTTGETSQYIAASAQIQRDVDSRTWYDDYEFEGINPDGLSSAVPPAADALGRNLFGEGSAAFAKGRITKRTANGVTDLSFFDNRGRIYARDRYLDLDSSGAFEESERLRLLYAYDNLGNLIALKYPNGHLLTQTFDGLGRLLNQGYFDGTQTREVSRLTYRDQTDGRPLIGAISLDPQRQFGPEPIYFTYDYNAANRVSERDVRLGTFLNLQYSYGFDFRGNVRSIASNAQTSMIEYDGLNRLTAAESGAYGPASGFDFDAVGNRLVSASGAEAMNYSYALWHGQGTNLVEQAGDRYFMHDERGRRLARLVLNDPLYYNPAGYAFDHYVYDDLNRLISVAYYVPQRGASSPEYHIRESYWYGPDGKRALKRSTGPSVAYLYDGESVISTFAPESGQATNYIFAEGKRIARYDHDGLTMLISDHLGSVDAEVRNGDTISAGQRDLYGNILTSDIAERFAVFGKETDSATGLIYMNARYYDPEIGRFISPDPFGGSAAKPATHNPFAYVTNNPLSLLDPTGLSGEDYEFGDYSQEWQDWPYDHSRDWDPSFIDFQEFARWVGDGSLQLMMEALFGSAAMAAPSYDQDDDRGKDDRDLGSSSDYAQDYRSEGEQDERYGFDSPFDGIDDELLTWGVDSTLARDAENWTEGFAERLVLIGPPRSKTDRIWWARIILLLGNLGKGADIWCQVCGQAFEHAADTALRLNWMHRRAPFIPGGGIDPDLGSVPDSVRAQSFKSE